MKKTIYFILFICNLLLYAHEQPVHQQIVREGWNLLKLSNPAYQYVEMNSWIGNNQNDGPWSFDNQGRVVAGSWREDDEDVVYGYDCPSINLFGINNYTNTHFWLCPNSNPANADYHHTLEGYSCGENWECGPVPGNALEQITKLYFRRMGNKKTVCWSTF